MKGGKEGRKGNKKKDGGEKVKKAALQ